MTTMGNIGQSLTALDDHALLQLLLRQDLPGYLTDIYNSEADRRLAAVKEPQPTTTMSLPFLQGGKQ
jgi:hypothetical protein